MQRDSSEDRQLPTKLIKVAIQSKKKSTIVIDEEFEIPQQDPFLIVRKVYDSLDIVVSEAMQQVLKAANKSQTSHFLIIQAEQRFTHNYYYIYLFDHYIHFLNIKEGMQILLPHETLLKDYIIFKGQQEDDSFFIFEPETLIAPSTLNSLQFCRRKGFLKEFFQNQCFGTSIEMLKGNIIHEFFQSLVQYPKRFLHLFNEISELQEQLKEYGELEIYQLPFLLVEEMEKYYSKYLECFYYLGKMTLDEAIKQCYKLCLQCIHWVRQHFILKFPLIIKFSGDNYQIIITGWEKNEQSISSSVYGMKGFLDVVVRIQYSVNNQQQIETLMPIELKTGLMQQYYESQVQTYLILMNQHYKQNIQIGLLLYLNQLDIQLVKCNKYSKNQLIFQRNLYISEIYHFERQPDCYTRLPEISDYVKSERDIHFKCSKCDMKSICFGLQILNQQDDPPIKIPEYEQMKSQLQNKSKAYLNSMLASLRQEEQANSLPQAVYYVKSISVEAREIVYCLQSKTYYLKQQAQEILNKCFQENKITLFSTITQKTQKFCLRNATMVQGGQMVNLIEEEQATEEIDENYEFAIQLKVCLESALNVQESIALNQDDQLIYKFFQKNSFKYYKQVIFDLALGDTFFSRKKDILIFGIEPQFKQETEFEDERKYIFDILSFKFKSCLNQDQFQAIKLCIQAEDFALIQGYPGTGKTHTIAHLLYLLGYIKKKVLICTYTHSALDNLLEKFVNEFPNQAEWIIRLGSTSDKISPTASKYHFQFKNYKNFDSFDKTLYNKYLYFSTCSSCVDVLQSQEFDYCIVEEASQIIEPLCISCILRSKVFILIGDYKQLQPLVKSNKASNLRRSLLERLDQEFKTVNCSQSLTIQYRMNSKIMKIANSLVYQNQLKPFNENQNDGLQLNQLPRDASNFEISLHQKNQSVLFLDTTHPEQEIIYACAVSKFLLKNGLDKSQLLIITSYNKLIVSLQETLKSKNIAQLPIITIDKSQGKDSDCIIVICSQLESGRYHLLQNIQRINVACTRAKKKLIMIGNSKYLESLESIKQLIQMFRQEGWLFSVDKEFIRKFY